MPFRRPTSIASLALAIAMAGATVAGPARAANGERDAFDARAEEPAPPAAPRAALREQLGDQALVTPDPLTGTVRAAGRLDGALTAPSARDGATVTLRYLRDHGRALGLRDGVADGLALESRSVTGGLELLTWSQSYRGIPSADTFLEAAVTGAGRLLSVTGAPADELAVDSIAPARSAGAALAAVTGDAAPAIEHRAAGAERATTFADGSRASLVLYQAGDETRLAWRVLAGISGQEVADALVDARDATVVRRANRVKFATNARVYETTPAAPSKLVDFDRWLFDPPITANGLSGPYARVFADPGPGDAPPVQTTDWQKFLTTFPGCAGCTWKAGSETANRDQSATQAFYLINRFRDHLTAAPIRFVDGAFAGSDRVTARTLHDALDGARNNASFLTLPDGTPGVMELNLFDHPSFAFDNRDSAFDPSLVYHEYTHGLTDRLVTDAQGFGALNTNQAYAIAEGTSDFYALDFITGDTVPPAGLKFGAYLGPWLRTAPIDGEYTYADFGQLFSDPTEPHYNGEIWAQTLWALRSELGYLRTREVVTDALRIAPPEPSFLDMRNAILVASQSDADDHAIWDVFAARGMGYFASTDGSDDIAPRADTTHPDDLGPVEDFEDLTGTVIDEDGAPVAGAQVAIAGAAQGLGPELAAVTGEAGTFTIRGPEDTPPLQLEARKPGYTEAVQQDVTFPGTAAPLRIARDWSSAATGAQIVSFTGPDNTGLGCGPGGLIDDDQSTVWGSSNVEDGQSIVVDLGAPVDVSVVAIDPAAGCGDDATAALGTAEVDVATSPGAFSLLNAPEPFAALHHGTLRSVFTGIRPAVRYVRLRAKAPADPTGEDGQRFIDVAELQVLKVPGSPVGPTVETGAATAVGPASATLGAEVIPNGAPPDVVFEYGATPAYGAIAPASGGPAASGTVTGLAPNTVYHYRVVALRDGRSYAGGDATFRTGPPVITEPPDPPAVKTSIRAGVVRADRKGRFRLRVTFGAAAPLGTARLSVTVGGRTVAAATVKVVRNATKTVPLRLTESGRKRIRAGARARKASVTLRLPGGAAVKQTLKLSRRR